MNIEEEIMEIANNYITGVEDSDYNVQPVIHIEDLTDFIKEILETFEVSYRWT